MKKYSRFVEFANDGPSFVAAIEKALNKQQQQKEARRDFIRKSSWASVAELIIEDCKT
ncbi:hypothetical protein [Desulfonema magnum]|uniref:Uncharacterized protein n=1 Tax=Desulfonema magnum TaxID=45655 RepID=A0A975BRE4_9BACT|nr:hypothetical protein [Desulfonema magnum]QTA90018.1 Uncharacterized protein dnm_060780 [Desulfonema magnum]